jgi:hypothetical protein
MKPSYEYFKLGLSAWVEGSRQFAAVRLLDVTPKGLALFAEGGFSVSLGGYVQELVNNPSAPKLLLAGLPDGAFGENAKAEITALIPDTGAIDTVAIKEAGRGYPFAPQASIYTADEGGSGAIIDVMMGPNGEVTELFLADGGSGYQPLKIPVEFDAPVHVFKFPQNLPYNFVQDIGPLLTAKEAGLRAEAWLEQARYRILRDFGIYRSATGDRGALDHSTVEV